VTSPISAHAALLSNGAGAHHRNRQGGYVFPGLGMSSEHAPPCSSTDDGGDPDLRSAVEKACELLVGLCGDGDSTPGVSELARRSGVTKSTAHRQLSMLERAGMIERVDRGYRAGRRLRVLAQEVCHGHHARLADALTPFLVELLEETRQTVQLAVLDGAEVSCMGKLSRHHSVSTRSRLGGRLPAHRTAGGKLLLAFRPSVAADFVALPLQAMTPETVCERAQLTSELSDIRSRGVAVDRGGDSLGVWCVAMPIIAPSGEAVAALSVCTPRGTNFATFGDALRRITRSASRSLAQLGPESW
jgi:IclR family transcriptional regulator, KDG regulon repressor